MKYLDVFRIVLRYEINDDPLLFPDEAGQRYREGVFCAARFRLPSQRQRVDRRQLRRCFDAA